MFSNHPYAANLKKDDDQLKGPVKLVIEQIMHWNSLRIAVKKFNDSGMLTTVHYFERENSDSKDILDTTGLKLVAIEKHEYSSKKLLLSSHYTDYIFCNKTEHSRKYFYDSNDSLSAIVINVVQTNKAELDRTNFYYKHFKDSVIEITVNNKKEIINRKTIHKNENGTLSNIVTIKPNGECATIEEFLYDKNGNAITILKSETPIDSFSDCKTYDKYNFVFNRDNKLISEEHIQRINNIKRVVIIHNYDSNGSKTKDLIFQYIDDNITSYVECAFNKNNDCSNLIMYEYFRYDKPVQISQESIKYTYQYDQNGNWTEKREYRNGEPIESNHKVRKITYY
jgi:hypothetical protein